MDYEVLNGVKTGGTVVRGSFDLICWNALCADTTIDAECKCSSDPIGPPVPSPTNRKCDLNGGCAQCAVTKVGRLRG